MATAIIVPVGLKPNLTVATITHNGNFSITHANGNGNPNRGKSVVDEPVAQGVAIEGP